MNSNFKILRIYMKQSEKVKHAQSFWQKLFNAGLGSFLIKEAKEFGIAQASLQTAAAGYLEGKRLTFNNVEVSPPDLPLCLELIDSEERLKSFIDQFRDDLKGCRIILFSGAELLRGEVA